MCIIISNLTLQAIWLIWLNHSDSASQAEMTQLSAGECLQAELMHPSVIQTLPNIKTSNAVNSTHLPLQER